MTEGPKINDRVFFITSNQSKLENEIQYTISTRDKAFQNLKILLKKEQKFKREDFTFHVHSFEVIKSELDDNYKIPETKIYKAKITLRYNRTIFEGFVKFKETKKHFNTFFYDLKFNEAKGFFGATPPPPSINFTKTEQIRIYNEILKLLKIKQGDPLSITLITDSLAYINKNKYYLDFYLEILRSCYTKVEVKMLLMKLNLEHVKLPEKIDNLNYYTNILNSIEKNPNLITKHCGEKDSKDKYYKFFYTLLLYFRSFYETERAKVLLDNKDLWKYFSEILPKNSKYFTHLKIPEELINEMLKTKDITFDIIKGTLIYLGSIEKVLATINDNCDLIANCCLKENQKINMIEISNPKKDDDLNKIIGEIQKVMNYQLNTKKVFLLFEEEFWKNYIHYNDQQNLQNLILIKKAILLYRKADNNLSLEKLDLRSKIHNTGLHVIEKGGLKNEQLLDFIENDDDYFKENRYENKAYRPLTILKGIDLEKANEIFFERWEKSNIFKIFEFNEIDFKRELVNKIDNMKDFGKLLKLFDYKNKKKFDMNTISVLREKFKNIIRTYKMEECPNFIKDVSFFIYVISQTYQDISRFMESTIEKYIQSNQTITDIYLYVASNYKDISQNVIDRISTYFTKNKDQLNGESILFLLKKFSSKSFLKSLLNKINTCVIKENQLFSQEKGIDSFILLKGIEQEELLKKFPELYETTYLIMTVKLSALISDKISKGEIKFRELSAMWVEKEKKNMIRERLDILLFNNINDVEKCMKELDERYKKIIKTTIELKKLNAVLKEFYEITHQNNIKDIGILEKKINEGMLNEIDKKETKESIDKMNSIMPKADLDKKFKLKKSIFFTHFYKAKKANNILKKEEDIFTETEQDFNKLKPFFEDNWIEKIDEVIIKECYRALKNKSDKNIKEELKFLRDNFNLKEKDDLYIEKLQDDIKIFSQKEEIFQTINSCLHFISEFHAKPTDFNTLLIQLKKDLSGNISVKKIKEYGKSLEKYGINILNPKVEDKDYLNILTALFSKKGSLSFIMSLTDEDCRTLQELVSESESTFLTGAEIQDMTKCSNFIHSMNITKDVTTDQELMKIFIEKVPQTKNISAYFIQYTNNSGQIQELYLQKLDKSQATRKQIKNIVKSSNFIISIKNEQETYLEFYGSFINDEKDKGNRTINFEDLIELRGRAMLAKKLGDEKSKEEKEIHELNKKFAERVNEIEKINDLLKKIAEKGYCENIKISVDIKDTNPVFYSSEYNFKDYEECSKYLNTILIKTTETQINYYKNEKTQLIRYIYGRQFNLLNSSLKNLSNSSISAFLKFLTNDQIQADVKLDKIDYNYNYDLNKKDKYVCLLENVNQFLKSFLDTNKLTLDLIYKQNIIKDKYKNEFKGLYTYYLKDDQGVQKGVEEHILNWYHFLTGNPPMAQTVLLCNEETTSEEIIAFMYRAFLCQYHVVFMVGKIELLTPDKRQTLTGLINTLFTGHEKEMKSCLAFAYSDKTSSIVLYLERIKGKQILEHKDNKNKEEIKYEENVEIISSDKSGVGKSTRIKNSILKKAKKYIHFPFGGEFDRKDVINRL